MARLGLPETFFETGLGLQAYVVGSYHALCKDEMVIDYYANRKMHAMLVDYARAAFHANLHPLHVDPAVFRRAGLAEAKKHAMKSVEQRRKVRGKRNHSYAKIEDNDEGFEKDSDEEVESDSEQDF